MSGTCRAQESTTGDLHFARKARASEHPPSGFQRGVVCPQHAAGLGGQYFAVLCRPTPAVSEWSVARVLARGPRGVARAVHLGGETLGYPKTRVSSSFSEHRGRDLAIDGAVLAADAELLQRCNCAIRVAALSFDVLGFMKPLLAGAGRGTVRRGHDLVDRLALRTATLDDIRLAIGDHRTTNPSADSPRRRVVPDANFRVSTHSHTSVPAVRL